MANPSGTNQFQGLGGEPVYGAVKRATELSREAPMSGAQIATRATEAPRRAKRRAQRGEAPIQTPAAPSQAPPAPVDPQAEVAAVGQAIANEPDASDLLRQIVAQGI